MTLISCLTDTLWFVLIFRVYWLAFLGSNGSYPYSVQPNIRRSFPGNGSNATHAKDDETNVDASSSTLYPTPQQQHGKQFRVTGGKGFRPDDAEDDDDDDDDEEEDEEENNSESSGDDDGDENPATSVPFRSGGKQLRAPGGKYLRPP